MFSHQHVTVRVSYAYLFCLPAVPQAIAERYTEQHDSLSVIVLYEAAVRDLEGVAGTGNAELSAMAKEANNLMYTLTPAEARVVRGCDALNIRYLFCVWLVLQ